MSEPLLQLRDFCVSYGPVEALHQVNLDVREGEIVTVIGPNGAGKTTLLSAAMGLLPSQGQLQFNGQPIQRPTVEAMVARGVGLVPEKRELFTTMTVEDNLVLGAYRRRKAGWSYRDGLEGIYAVFPQSRHLPLRTRLWVEHLRSHYGRADYWRG